ncbi:MAG: PQQ-binding-like beta-propeller repeat protein, partial [Planctomycetaceae bacterium]|nr:PQQ-binding-like beta-propeller repeat protein [Planctomycetaceae bacterium]
EQIEELQDDRVDQGYAPVPAFTSITVNNKAIFRTLRGVRVTDVESGRTLWETRSGITAESLITGMQNQSNPTYQDMQFFGGGMPVAATTYNGSSGNVPNERITSLLFRNGTWGGLSSDGDQLFVLEDHAVLIPYSPGDYRAVQGRIQDNLRRDYATNKIVSYNLKTGRPRWEIGGTAMDEPFDRRLAGQYFFGVPVANEGELFAIGERDNEIRMFVLEKETGREKWSQLVAYSDAKIDRDFGRRWWNAQVGVGQGVIVCPKTVGWLIGIDRLNRSVLWAYRYSKPQPDQGNSPFSHQQNNLIQRSNLNEVWGPSAPVIVGHRVVYTPPEDNMMVCLDLFTGKKLWSKSKEDLLYLAGVFENQAVVVGKSHIAGISMESGSTTWTLSFSEDDGRPSGMGVAVDHVYHLPLTSRQLWTVDLKSGKVINKAELPDGLPLLGNLAMYRGLLLSLGAKGMTAYAQEEAIEKEIIALRQKDSNDAWAMLFDANIKVLKGKYELALTLLNKVNTEALPPELQSRYRDLMMQSLIALIQSDLTEHNAEYAKLQDFVKSKEERLTFRRLTADRLRARREVQSAFDEYLALGESDGQLLISRDDDPRVKLSMDRWLSGRFEQLWQEVSGDDRARLDERIAASAEAAQAQGVEASQRFLVLFGFHPQAVSVRRALVEEFALSGDVALAQNQLLKLSRNSD